MGWPAPLVIYLALDIISCCSVLQVVVHVRIAVASTTSICSRRLKKVCVILDSSPLGHPQG